MAGLRRRSNGLGKLLQTTSKSVQLFSIAFVLSRGAHLSIPFPALANLDLLSDPPILETFIRSSTSQWIIARRSDSTTSLSTAISATDIYAVLPSKVSSLVDAGDELRKLERTYPRTLGGLE